jgi:large subunit ribosomal protein L32
MAVPRRKHSKTRRDKRRTHQRATVPTFSNCAQCGEPKIPHRACSNCGFYRGREVIEVEEL